MNLDQNNTERGNYTVENQGEYKYRYYFCLNPTGLIFTVKNILKVEIALFKFNSDFFRNVVKKMLEILS